MSTEVLVLNGPNLNRLGTREPTIYGDTTYDEVVALCQATGADLDLSVQARQTNDEAQMLGWLHEAADTGVPVVINPGAWSHYSYALRDAVTALTGPVVEVHISNIHAREEFRHHSVVSAVVNGVIAGLGVQGYVFALRWIATQLTAT